MACQNNLKLGTESQKTKLNTLLDCAKTNNYSTIKVLQDIQEIYGYLPESVLSYYSKTFNKPLSEIYSVATFYAGFSLNPKGKYVISVCTGTACYVNGSKDILDKFCNLLNIEPGKCTADGKFSIDQTRCLGCCGLAPVVMINEKVYNNVKITDIEKILSEYTKENK